MKNTQGAVPIGALRNDEILERAKAHPLWAVRATRKPKYETANPGKRYGVGFAHVQKDYGTGGEAAIATLEVDRDGRVTLRHVAPKLELAPPRRSRSSPGASWAGCPIELSMAWSTGPKCHSPRASSSSPWRR